jgi:hypothetical protein
LIYKNIIFNCNLFCIFKVCLHNDAFIAFTI